MTDQKSTAPPPPWEDAGRPAAPPSAPPAGGPFGGKAPATSEPASSGEHLDDALAKQREGEARRAAAAEPKADAAVEGKAEPKAKAERRPRRGRPKGSKNKPKAAPAPVVEARRAVSAAREQLLSASSCYFELSPDATAAVHSALEALSSLEDAIEVPSS